MDDFALRETVAYPGVPRGDLDAFLSRTQEVLASPELRHDLEEQGRRHAAQYTWKRTAEHFLTEMEAFVSASQRRQGVASINRIGAPPPQVSEARQKAPGVDDAAARECAARSRALAHNLSAYRAPDWPPFGQANPKLSCLTVTVGRLTLLKRAVRCYCDQTYRNRELVIVTDADGRRRQAIEEYLSSLERPDIRFIPVEGVRSLGALRNIALESAGGEIVCQWDDDDLYHPQRLEKQAAPLIAQGEGACLLTDQLHFFEAERALFWVDWTAGGRVQAIWQLIPGSLMMYKQRFRYPETGSEAKRGEDSALLEALYAKHSDHFLTARARLPLCVYLSRPKYLLVRTSQRPSFAHRASGIPLGAQAGIVACH